MFQNYSQPSDYMVPHPQIQSTSDYVVLLLFIEKIPYISGPVQFKRMGQLFKNQLSSSLFPVAINCNSLVIKI